MPRPTVPSLPADGRDGDPGHDEAVPESRPGAATPASEAVPDLASLSIVGITRRRSAAFLGVLLAGWIVIVFTRQVGDASAATARANEIAQANAALGRNVSALQRELDLIGRQRYIEQQARGYGLGGEREIAFSLAPGAPALPADAPGSATVRVGARDETTSPLERWLTVLFGPSD